MNPHTLASVYDDAGRHRASICYAPFTGDWLPEISIRVGNSNQTPPFTYDSTEARLLAAALNQAADRYDQALDAALRIITEEGAA